ncbi:MAG: hypothetical protein ACI95S_001222 [Dinoroseobacter sp.]|jgi:hypothetical protein
MSGVSDRWADFPDYILGITKEIWEDRGIATLNHYYTPDMPLRTPMGVSVGNQPVIAATMATCYEVPDRQVFGEDVIWLDHPEHGLLSSHRVISTGTHTRDGQFGKATGRRFTIRVIADCATKDDQIYDEWLVRDYGGLLRQLGHDPRAFAAGLIAREGGVASAARPFSPETDIAGAYHGRGNDNAWGARYAALLDAAMRGDFRGLQDGCDRAVLGQYPGARDTVGMAETSAFWLGLRASFPSATFKIHHQIGMDADMLSPRAALRWSLDGVHDGWGAFGAPSGAQVHVMGMSHAEFGPWGMRRETALYDEVAIWKQILLHSG